MQSEIVNDYKGRIKSYIKISKNIKEQYPLKISRVYYNDIIRCHPSNIKGRFNADW